MEQSTAIDKALDVLFFLRRRGEACGVTEIGSGLSLPKSSVHRLLSTLARRGLVERDTRGRYRLGVGLLLLGQGVVAGEPMVAIARPALKVLSETLGETSFLVAARNHRLVVLDKAERPGLLRVSPEIGAQIPIVGTAVGRVYLAFDESQLQDGSGELAAARDQASDDQLAETRAAGYASNFGQWIEGLCVFSAPVFGKERLVAALAVAMPTGRFSEAIKVQVVEALQEAAARVSARVEGREG